MPTATVFLEGVQHNTYDVEFYGPNPMCGIYYLGALRAGEEMARSMGDGASADDYHRLFRQGSSWIDSNLFNGSFYIQKVRGYPADQIAPNLRSDMGSGNTESPNTRWGADCLIDQLVGQYLAQVAGLGSLVAQEHVQSTLQSIYKYNYKRSLEGHDNVERTFALNDEAAMVICDYGTAPRPRIPFPYFAEVMTGFEHSTAALMMYCGMVEQGIESIRTFAPGTMAKSGIRGMRRSAVIIMRALWLPGRVWLLSVGFITMAHGRRWLQCREFRITCSNASGRPEPAGERSPIVQWVLGVPKLRFGCWPASCLAGGAKLAEQGLRLRCAATGAHIPTR